MLLRSLLLFAPALLLAQSPAIQLDLQGKGAEARQLFQKDIDSANTPLAKANAQRAMAMSWAFEGNCAKAAEYERLVIDYWKTQEKDEPGNAFYQQGEMANEAGRVCIDAANLDMAASLYHEGFDAGIKEPNLSPDRAALWQFRLEHAEARLAARWGDEPAADKHAAAAMAALQQMTTSRAQQEAFVPYLTAYVAFYSNHFEKALEDFRKANQGDPFIQCMTGETLLKLGKAEEAKDFFRKALTTRAHNPPAAYAVRMARAKLASVK